MTAIRRLCEFVYDSLLAIVGLAGLALLAAVGVGGLISAGWLLYTYCGGFWAVSIGMPLLIMAIVGAYSSTLGGGA